MSGLLGEYVYDNVTGFRGFCTARCEIANSRNPLLLVEPAGTDTTGRPLEPRWIDETRCTKDGNPRKVRMF
jgi:hypothetical protein